MNFGVEQGPQPGWYDDPANPDYLAWWDGETWQRQHTQPRPGDKKKKGTGTVWIVLGVIVIFVAIAIAITGGKTKAATPKAAATTTIAPVASTSPPTTADPVTCHPLSGKGSCFEAGASCPAADQGVTGLSGEGETITCEQDKGLRWVRA